jgi:hypothetical protein
MTEEELVIFDILTRPAPALSPEAITTAVDEALLAIGIIIVRPDLQMPAVTKPHADADHRAGQPRLPRQGQRRDRGLRQRLRLA